MCAQCMVAATTAAAGATGGRAWLATRGWEWVTPRRLRAISGGLISAAVAFAAVGGG